MLFRSVKHPANGRSAVGVDLHQVEAAFPSDTQGLFDGNHPVVLAVRPNETDLFDADPVIYPKLSDYSCPLSVSKVICATVTGQYSTIGERLQC